MTLQQTPPKRRRPFILDSENRDEKTRDDRNARDGAALRPVPPKLEVPPPKPTTLNLLQRLIQVVIEPPVPVKDGPEMKVVVIHVETSGIPVPAPEFIINAGVPLIIRQRHHSSQRTGYISFEGRQATTNLMRRVELHNNDSFNQIMRSLKDLWFDADDDDTFFELVFRQSKRKISRSD